MSANTIHLNQNMTQFDQHDSVWLFAYGSLIFKVDFPFLARRPAFISGWQRRFWQGSHDHRGTVNAPGRVATLVPRPGVRCAGMGYLITPAVFSQLDYREKNGYLRLSTEITFEDHECATGLVYIATEENSAFLGPASEEEIARQIASARGASGHNADYLLGLADALRGLGEEDTHVFTIERHLLTYRE